MALSSCFFTSRLWFSLKNDRPRFSCDKIRYEPIPKGKNSEYVGWSFVRGSPITSRPNLGRNMVCRKSSVVYASWLPCSEIASGAFTLGTVAVLPFYTSMVVAPRADFTKKLVTSSLPYMVLGALYAYLLYLSWTPDTIRFMFASEYWLPELPGIAKMFSSELTLASAWIHLLTVDLFTARQVYEDGLQHDVEIRHSVCLCLLFCPVGILAHFVTKTLTKSRREKEHCSH